MKIIKEITLILGISLIGTFLSEYMPLPASILALFILLILLFSKKIKQTQIKDISSFFLTYMPLFFVPATVKIMVDFHYIAPQFMQYMLVCCISTLLTFLVSGFVVKTLLKGVKK